jgi:hypothetical protein
MVLYTWFSIVWIETGQDIFLRVMHWISYEKEIMMNRYDRITYLVHSLLAPLFNSL